MGYNILIVDDEENFRDLFAMYLETKSFCKEVFNAGDGLEALKLCENNKIDVAFVDLVMPNMDGLTLAAELKQIHPEVKVIIMSALYTHEVTQNINKLGIEYYLLKPFEFDNVEVLFENFVSCEVKNDCVKKIRNIKDLEKFLFCIGIPHHLKGFEYIKEAYNIAFDDYEILDNVTNSLYVQIGEKFNTSKVNVERNIRHAIELAWNNPENINVIEDIFGGYCTQKNGRPTNKAFLKMVYNHFDN